MSDTIGKLAVVTSVENAALKTGFRDAILEAIKFQKSMDKTTNVEVAHGNLKKVTDQFRQMDAHAKGVGASLRSHIVAGVVSGGTAAAAMIGGELLGTLGGSLGDIVKDSIQIAASMETTEVAFETMAGGADKARAVLKDLRQFAKESPLTFAQGSKVAGNILAAGIRPEQTVPTIRMLSDAGRGDPQIIDRLALAYTQVRSKGHLMGQELNQFAETGLPLEQALADVLGKQKDEIRGMVENARVGFPDVQRALKKLTEEGGAFYGMTDKYSKTFSGQMDGLRDSVEMAKGAFGRAIIEEVGLKEAASDTAKFADSLHNVVNEARPAIRFVGDLVKAGVQLGYLGVRLTGVLGNEVLKSMTEKFPAIGRTVEMVRGALKDIESARFDDQKVKDFGKGFGDVLAAAIDQLADSETWKKFQKRWTDGIVDPLINGLKGFNQAMQDWKDTKEGGKKIGAALTSWDGLADALTTKAERDASAQRKHEKEMAALPDEGFDPVPRGRDDQREQERAYARALRRASSPILGGWALADPVKPVANANSPIPVNIVGQEWDKAIQGMEGLHGLLGVSAGLLKDRAETVLKNRVQVEQGRNAQLRDRYKPESDKFREGMDDLQKALSEKNITDREYALAVNDLAKHAQSVAGEARLPMASEYGSQELAAALAKATAGTVSMSAEAILGRMEKIEQQQLDAANRMLELLGSLPMTPPVVKMPQQ